MPALVQFPAGAALKTGAMVTPLPTLSFAEIAARAEPGWDMKTDLCGEMSLGIAELRDVFLGTERSQSHSGRQAVREEGALGPGA